MAGGLQTVRGRRRGGPIAPPQQNRWFEDSPLEGHGFELSVPRESATVLSLRPLFISLKCSRSAERIDLCKRDRKLESRSLQQTVRLSRDFSFLYRNAGC